MVVVETPSGSSNKRGDASWERNDRLVAVAGGSKGHASARSLADIDPFRLRAIESFFADYHRPDGDAFRVIGHGRRGAADEAVRRAHRAYLEGRAGRAPGDGGSASRGRASRARSRSTAA